MAQRRGRGGGGNGGVRSARGDRHNGSLGFNPAHARGMAGHISCCISMEGCIGTRLRRCVFCSTLKRPGGRGFARMGRD